jgi:hypothetical protein
LTSILIIKISDARGEVLRRSSLNIDAYTWNFIRIYVIFISLQGFIVFVNGLEYGLVANPTIPLWYRLSDEFFLISVIGLILLSNKVIFLKINKSIFFIEMLLFIMFLFIMTKEILQFGNILNIKYIKNIVLIMLFIYLVEYIIKSKRAKDFIIFFGDVVAFSLLLSILHYLFFPYIVYEYRLIGAYGNPNTVGFVSVFSICMSLISLALDQNKRKFIGKMIISIIALIMSASFVAFFQLIYIFLLSIPLRYLLHLRFKIQKRVVILAGFLMLIFLISNQEIIEQILYKLELVLGGSTTVSNRYSSYKEWLSNLTAMSLIFGSQEFFRYLYNDSSWLNIFQKYGIVPIGIYYSFVGFAFIKIFIDVKSKALTKTQTLVSFYALLFFCSVFFVNVFGQYQLQQTIPAFFTFLTLILIVRVRAF